MKLNIKINILILLCFVLFFNCANEAVDSESKSEVGEKEAKISSSKIENFDCEMFFEKGNYSSICFVDSKLPKHNGGGCIFNFQTNGDKQEEDLKIQFVPKGSELLAQMHFDLNKNNYKKGSIKVLSNLGDAAFFDVHTTDLKSLSRSNKDLHVRYKNITFVLFASYQSNRKAPCFYDDKELIAFAERIIENL